MHIKHIGLVHETDFETCAVNIKLQLFHYLMLYFQYQRVMYMLYVLLIQMLFHIQSSEFTSQTPGMKNKLKKHMVKVAWAACHLAL